MARELGEIVHYFEKPMVAVVKVLDEFNLGDNIHIKGATTDFTQMVESMQVEHGSIEQANAGMNVGVKVNEKVRVGDKIFLEE